MVWGLDGELCLPVFINRLEGSKVAPVVVWSTNNGENVLLGAISSERTTGLPRIKNNISCLSSGV